MKKVKTTKHPDESVGGTFTWYEQGDRFFSVLDTEYIHNDKFELWERRGVEGGVIPGTEQQFDTLAAAEKWINAQ